MKPKYDANIITDHSCTEIQGKKLDAMHATEERKGKKKRGQKGLGTCLFMGQSQSRAIV